MHVSSIASGLGVSVEELKVLEEKFAAAALPVRKAVISRLEKRVAFGRPLHDEPLVQEDELGGRVLHYQAPNPPGYDDLVAQQDLERVAAEQGMTVDQLRARLAKLK